MKRLIIFITTLLLTTITVSAQQISREVAAQKATAFVDKANPQVKQLLTLAYKADKPATALAPKDDAYLYHKNFDILFVHYIHYKNYYHNHNHYIYQNL